MRPKVGLRQLKDGYPKPTVRQGRMIGDGRTLRWQAPTPKGRSIVGSRKRTLLVF